MLALPPKRWPMPTQRARPGSSGTTFLRFKTSKCRGAHIRVCACVEADRQSTTVPSSCTQFNPRVRIANAWNDTRRCKLDLIRFGGHLPKGGYDVRNGRYTKPASAPAVLG
jgi:hypothetical protein